MQHSQKEITDKSHILQTNHNEFELKMSLGTKEGSVSLSKRQQKQIKGTSLETQWLRNHTSTAGGLGSIPGPGTKMPHAMQHGQKKKKL